MTTRSKPGNTGKRYSQKQRDEIIGFILARGRGGVAAAIRKYKVSYSAIRHWFRGSITPKRRSLRAKTKGQKTEAQIRRARILLAELNRSAKQLQVLLKTLLPKKR